jgi:hypothetical protein
MIGGGCRCLPPPERVVPAPAHPDAATALPRRSGALTGEDPSEVDDPPVAMRRLIWPSVGAYHCDARFLISLISANDRTSRVKPCRHW